MPPHPLTNFEIQKYFENEPRINGVFSSYNMPKKVKDRAYIINYFPKMYLLLLILFTIEVKLFISIVLVLNMFLKKLKNLSGIEI